MPRKASPRVKTVNGIQYWVKRIKGRECVLGRYDEISNKAEAEAIARVKENELENEELERETGERKIGGKRGGLVNDMVGDYLLWQKASGLSDNHQSTTKSVLKGFQEFTYKGGIPLGKRRPIKLDYRHLSAYINSRSDLTARSKKQIRGAVVALWNWAAGNGKTRAGGEWFERGYSAMEGVEIPVDIVVRMSRDLITEKERQAFRRHFANRVGYVDLLDLLYHTGARPGELIGADCGHYDAELGALVLTKHKNAKSTHKARYIMLNPDAVEIVERLVAGRASTDPLLTGGYGRRLILNNVAKYWRKLRDDKAKPMRKHLTPYAFRDLYISEQLRQGVDISDVAFLAGNSERVIRESYQHFFLEDIRKGNNDLARARKLKIVRKKKAG